MNATAETARELTERFGAGAVTPQPAADGTPTFWVPAGRLREVIRFLRREIPRPYGMLYDLFGIDERERLHRPGQPASDFTVVYHLLSFDRNADVRLKVALTGEAPSVPGVSDLCPNADWYERELWDMFGLRVEGRPDLRRLLMPADWQGHPLRKEHPARATEMEPFRLPEARQEAAQRLLQFKPEEWGLAPGREDADYMFLNLGPHHLGTHGLLRLVVQLDGEEIVAVVPEIGFHHRAAEKMGERQSWHTYIPYTDRVDYLAGTLNNLPYCLSVEALAGIEAPERAVVIRVMLCELFRVLSHLVWYGTYAADLGAMSPVFYTFNDRERGLDIVKAITGARMHPGWFRIGGVAADLPEGWDRLVTGFIAHMRRQLKEYDALILGNRIFQARTKGIGAYTLAQAIDWGVTGPNLRACGLAWDFRKKRPYSGYDRFDFDIPTATAGDCYDRAVVRIEEMRQSLRILEQCVGGMPPGPYKARHPLTTPPVKDATMRDIETLIAHFLSVSWGPVIPPGEAGRITEGAKGAYSYFLVSDGDTRSYRTRIRSASFAHIQTVPMLGRGFMLSDLITILGSIDFVMGDVDR